MFGLDILQVKNIVESRILSSSGISRNPELRSLATLIAEGVANAVQENNRKITEQVKEEIRRKTR